MSKDREELYEVSSRGQSFAEDVGSLLRDGQEFVSFCELDPIDNFHYRCPNDSTHLRVVNSSFWEELRHSQMRMGNELFGCNQKPLEEPLRLAKKDQLILRNSALLEEFVECAPLLPPIGAVAHQRKYPLRKTKPTRTMSAKHRWLQALYTHKSAMTIRGRSDVLADLVSSKDTAAS